MRIQFDHLGTSLRRKLAPVYLICGDEPMQLGEAVRMVRESAAREGFTEREILEADAGFDWGRLAFASQALSLFASRRLIEVRLSSARMGREGGSAVSSFCGARHEDTLLLIVAPNLEYKELRTKWAGAVERSGVLVQVRPLVGKPLEDWIHRQLLDRGLEPARGVASVLAERAEGNLLAAAQEVEKLALIQGRGPLTLDGLAGAISDSSRFDLFDIADAALGADRARTHRVLRGLSAEGTAELLVLWALAREVRLLARAAFAARRDAAALEALLDAENVWKRRRALVRGALKRLPVARLQRLLEECALADRQIKGLDSGDPWLTMAGICDGLAGSEDACAGAGSEMRPRNL